MRQNTVRSIILSVFGLLALFLATSSLAAKKPPGGHLNIETVQVVEGDPDTLLITGEDFDFGDDALIVNLGSIGDLVITSDSATEIVAELPADLPPGDYLLTVSRGDGGQSKGDEYDLTIGLTKALADLTKAQADICALYVLSGNLLAAPDYCSLGCPCFDQAFVNDASVTWDRCEARELFGTEYRYALCTDGVSWDGDDNCMTSPPSAKVVKYDSRDWTCSSDASQIDPITEAQGQSCIAIIQAVAEAKGLCCSWNNNVCTE